MCLIHSLFSLMNLQYLSVRFGDQSINIPYYHIKGTEKGPHIFLSGGMHGDEVNGIAGVHRFLQYAREHELEKTLKGQITVIPLLNPSGFMKMERKVRQDHVDLNRSFGIEEATNLAEAIAHELTEKLLKHCILGIDLHDAGGGTVLLPHTRVLKHEEDGCTRGMGQLFGTQIVIEREGHPNMMAVALHRLHKVPVITVETGGAQTIFPELVEKSLQGVLNILIAYGLIEGDVKTAEKQYFLHKRLGVQATEAGLVQLDVELGDFVHVDQKIGTMYFPATQHETDLVSPLCGILFAKWHKSQIPKGKVIYAVLETEECHGDRQNLHAFEELPRFQLKQFDFSK